VCYVVRTTVGLLLRNRPRARRRRSASRDSRVDVGEARASPIINRRRRLVLDLIERVVVGGHTRVVDLFKTNDDRVAHAGLVDGDNLAVIVEPVRLRAQNLNLYRRNGTRRITHGSVTRSIPRAHTDTHTTLSLSSVSRRRRAFAPARDRASSRIESHASSYRGASRRADLGLRRRRRRLLRAHKNTTPHRQSLTSTIASHRVTSRAHPSPSRSRIPTDVRSSRRTSASARTTARDARVVFVALRDGTKYLCTRTVSHPDAIDSSSNATRAITHHRSSTRSRRGYALGDSPGRSIDRSFERVDGDDERTETRATKKQKNDGRT